MVEMLGSWKPLVGASDMHIHIGPDFVERYYTSLELAEDAAQQGMKAVVLKDQLCPSMFKAALTQKLNPQVKVFGSLVMNAPCGGISPRSVAYALKCGAKVIWFPTVDAAYCQDKGNSGHWIKRVNDRNSFNGKSERLTVLDKDGNVAQDVLDIMKMVAEKDAVLASGHISPDECIAILKANKDIGVKFVITHPNLWFDDFNEEKLKEMVSLGAYLEMTMGGLMPNRGHGDIYEMVRMIKAVGPEHCTLATDAGAVDCAAPPENLREFCYLLKNCGMTKEEVETMVRDNPAKLLGL